MNAPERLPNGLTPEQDAAMDRLAEAIIKHRTSPPPRCLTCDDYGLTDELEPCPACRAAREPGEGAA